MSYSDWFKIILAAYGVYKDTQGTKLKQVPEDPGLIALRAKMLGYVDNSPTRNLLAEMLKPMLARSSNQPYQLPQGVNGYNPYPNGNAQPQYDLTKIFGLMDGMNKPQASTVGGGGGDSLAPKNQVAP